MKIKNLLLFSILSLTLISCTNTNYEEANNVIYASPGEGNFIADEPVNFLYIKCHSPTFSIHAILLPPNPKK